VATWLTLLASWRFTKPEDNVNWVYSRREEIRSPRTRAGFVLLLMILIPLACHVPAHVLFSNYGGDVAVAAPGEALLTTYPGPLTPDERATLQKHAEYGWAILRRIPGFETVALYILHHHERIDGKGYPSGISGELIPIGARIVAVVDAFDAMVSERCYRGALPIDEALRRLRESAGTQFDAAIVEEFAWIAEAHAREIQALTAIPLHS